MLLPSASQITGIDSTKNKTANKQTIKKIIQQNNEQISQFEAPITFFMVKLKHTISKR